MKLNLFFIVMALFISCTQKSKEELNPVAKRLFANVQSKLTVVEKNQIADSLKFIVVDKDSLNVFALAEDSSTVAFPFSAEVFPLDLNNDGIEELFVGYGNTYTSGNAGSETTLFIKEKEGYRSQFTYSGVLPFVLPTSNAGYPDLVAGIPGFTFPVYHWDGKTYLNNKQLSDQKLRKLATKEVDVLSKSYQDDLKKQ